MFASRHSMLTSSLSFVKVCLLVCDCALGLGVVGVRLGVRLGGVSGEVDRGPILEHAPKPKSLGKCMPKTGRMFAKHGRYYECSNTYRGDSDVL